MPALALPGRRAAAHLAVFDGREELAGDAPLALVHGNCQAESLRLVLGGADLTTLRIPPVHELTAEDLPPLRRWLARAAVLVSQPVRDGYRGLPLGTGQLAAELPRGARLVTVPVVRFAGLYPAHAIVRPPADRSLVPPVVAYHDLRLLAEAAGHALPPLSLAGVRAVAAASLDALRARERAHETVVVSDLFARPHFGLMRTLNHPGNPIWLALAARVRARLGLTDPPADPGRPLLDSVHAPREEAVIAAFALDAAPRADWRLDGRPVSAATVRAAHLHFYAARPDVVAAGLTRHAAALRALGLR